MTPAAAGRGAWPGVGAACREQGVQPVGIRGVAVDPGR